LIWTRQRQLNQLRSILRVPLGSHRGGAELIHSARRAGGRADTRAQRRLDLAGSLLDARDAPRTVVRVTERTAFGIIVDLTEAGYVVKEKEGRRNRYRIQEHLPLHDSISQERTIGEVLDLFVVSKRKPASRSTRS
jgi:DNA-binding transcriptional ArsR family regulator